MTEHLGWSWIFHFEKCLAGLKLKLISLLKSRFHGHYKVSGTMQKLKPSKSSEKVYNNIFLENN